MTKTLKCRVFCDYQQVTQCFAQIKHLVACSRVKLGKAVKEGSKLIKLYRAQPPLVQMKSPSTSSNYCSSNTPAASSLPLLLVGSLWRGPADHAESANVHGCVRETLAGGSEGFMMWVMRSCIISPVGVCVLRHRLSHGTLYGKRRSGLPHRIYSVCLCGCFQCEDT